MNYVSLQLYVYLIIDGEVFVVTRKEPVGVVGKLRSSYVFFGKIYH